MVSMLSDASAMRLSQVECQRDLVKILFLMILLSYFDQSNVRRRYDGKCRNCSRVWFEVWVGCQDRLRVNSDADETLA